MEKNENIMKGWVTPSQYAEQHNISVQTVYNKIEQGIIECKAYKRGSMNGFLVKEDCECKDVIE